MISGMIRNHVWLMVLLGGGVLLGNAVLQQDSSPVISSEVRFKKVVIFDVGQVLAVHSEGALGKKIGWRAFLRNGLGLLFKLKHLKRELIKPIWFAVLEEAAEYPDDQRMYEDNGDPCPKGMCALNAGLISLEQLRSHANVVIDGWLEEDAANEACGNPRTHFMSDVQADMVRTIIHTVFDKKTLVQSYTKLPGADVLAYALAQPDVCVMILSNFPVEQFAELQAHIPDLFHGIPRENIFVSGMELAVDECGTDSEGKPLRLAIKPNVEAFATLARICKLRWNVEPENIIMIDNQRINIRGALKAGIQAYLVNAETEGDEYNHTFDELQKKLEQDFLIADKNGLFAQDAVVYN